MTLSWAASCGQDTRPGCKAEGMTKRRTSVTEMCTTETRTLRFKRDMEKYRRYAEAKAKIPKDLSAREYEEAVKELAKRFRI